MNRLKKALKLAFPSWSQKAYLRRMRKSRLFDRQFYLSTNPGMHWLFRLFPERHFLLMGETAGLFPNPDFSPSAYLRHNADVVDSGLAPFDHYLRAGRQEVRLTKDLPEARALVHIDTPRLRNDLPAKRRFAVVVHMYYHELWEEFFHKLQKVDVDFDLIVTVTYRGAESDTLERQIVRDWSDARVVKIRNHGRDIFPFVHLINAGWLHGYDAVCKVHTKKSPHRQDGDVWRKHLISGILPDAGTQKPLEQFLDDDRAAFWVADGQHYDDAQWWGSNFDRVCQLMHRVEIAPDRDRLSFPAGSMYWLKPSMIDMIRGLYLTEQDFDPECGQTDGTLAHAFERALGLMADAAGQTVRQTSQLRAQPPRQMARPKFVSAFYLPQFHPNDRNDAWWGKGFTEWSSVTRAKSEFAGHKQPVLPSDLGFYDLRHTETMAKQAAVAAQAGINAFCVYHYWFDGARILEDPIDRLLDRPDLDFPFYLCWANESWRRNWDGLSGEVLMPQSYTPGFEEALAKSLLPYFADPRYQRPDGTRPRFVIYRPEDMPDPPTSVARLRNYWRDAGVGEVELGAVLFHIRGSAPIDGTLFDFWIEMPPHGLVNSQDYLFGGPSGDVMQAGVAPSFRGLIYDYDKMRATSQSKSYLGKLPQNVIAGVMPSWDNTARRGPDAHIAYGANPARFERWLREAKAHRVQKSYRNELFINAWNEWAE
ncbi:MAG: glycoside hydrolase family 99-like domain-containing protein, partial [Sulfitobacter sp.]